MVHVEVSVGDPQEDTGSTKDTRLTQHGENIQPGSLSGIRLTVNPRLSKPLWLTATKNLFR